MSAIAAYLIPTLWAAWGAYWVIAARDTKATLRREAFGARFLHVGPLMMCALFFLSPNMLPAAMSHRFLPAAWSAYWAGVALVVVGMMFAVWARLHLGRNWSGVITLKADHTLIRSGPYRLVRHPIYAGLLLAIVGSAIALGEWRGLAGLGLALVAIATRVAAEDALMAATFGDAYSGYRRQTKALIPFIV